MVEAVQVAAEEAGDREVHAVAAIPEIEAADSIAVVARMTDPGNGVAEVKKENNKFSFDIKLIISINYFD